MTQPAASIPKDQAAADADGMIVCDRLVRVYSGQGIELQALQGLPPMRLSSLGRRERLRRAGFLLDTLGSALRRPDSGSPVR